MELIDAAGSPLEVLMQVYQLPAANITTHIPIPPVDDVPHRG
jgi:hypothetical protein